ncbi:MAG: hypothetical protein MUC85_07955 [Anaerolineales bacterium]|jgi:hypothetical protein|nr:hypothetical protein [Anaerolineales bacterium]
MLWLFVWNVGIVNGEDIIEQRMPVLLLPGILALEVQQDLTDIPAKGEDFGRF